MSYGNYNISIKFDVFLNTNIVSGKLLNGVSLFYNNLKRAM